MDTINLAYENQLTEIMQVNEWVMVYFWAVWCEPCQAMTPLVERIADKHPDQLAVVKANVDKLPELTQNFNLRGIPTLLLFYKGQAVSRSVGALNEQSVDQWLRDQWFKDRGQTAS